MGNAVVHFEVMGSDTEQLNKFYGELFGWHIEHMPEMNYGVVDTHGGSGINGGLGVTQDGSQYVTFYIEVDDINATLSKIEKAGGKTLQPRMEVPNVVIFAHFSDIAGNLLGLVEPLPGMENQGGPSAGKNPEVGWFEVLGKDADALAKFYTTLFGWKADRHEMGGGMIYHEVKTEAGKGTDGGIGNAPGVDHACLVYAGVQDITATLKHAEELGGKIVMPEMKVTEQTTIGQFADPQGNVFGLYKGMPK
jgi:hypothetical protein